jgi:hypothetical protein
VREYTIARVRAFVMAIGRSQSDDRLVRLHDLRAAAATKKDFEGYVKKLK